MSLGHQAMMEIVNRDHPAEVTPAGTGVREAVHQVDTGSRREPRQQLLFTSNPLRPVARADRHRHGLDQVSPRSIAGLGALAADERREARVGGRDDQLRDQLACVYLGASGLAGNEEDEVEADVHGAGG